MSQKIKLDLTTLEDRTMPSSYGAPLTWQGYVLEDAPAGEVHVAEAIRIPLSLSEDRNYIFTYPSQTSLSQPGYYSLSPHGIVVTGVSAEVAPQVAKQFLPMAVGASTQQLGPDPFVNSYIRAIAYKVSVGAMPQEALDRALHNYGIDPASLVTVVPAPTPSPTPSPPVPISGYQPARDFFAEYQQKTKNAPVFAAFSHQLLNIAQTAGPQANGVERAILDYTANDIRANPGEWTNPNLLTSAITLIDAAVDRLTSGPASPPLVRLIGALNNLTPLEDKGFAVVGVQHVFDHVYPALQSYIKSEVSRALAAVTQNRGQAIADVVGRTTDEHLASLTGTIPTAIAGVNELSKFTRDASPVVIRAAATLARVAAFTSAFNELEAQGLISKQERDTGIQAANARVAPAYAEIATGLVAVGTWADEFSAAYGRLAIDLGDTRASTQHTLAGAEFRLGNWASAESAYLLTIQKDANMLSVTDRFSLASAQAQQGKLADASYAQQVAINKGGGSAAAFQTLARYQAQSGQWKHVAYNLSMAAQLEPLASTFLGVADAYDRLGDTAAANYARLKAANLSSGVK